MLTSEGLADLLSLNHELRVAEFKSAGSPSDREYLAKIARACLAMANQRGGGHVVIGVDDTDPLHGPSGLNPAALLEWLDFDTVSARINTYADPPIELEIASVQHPGGAEVVVIEITEFRDVPILCKKAYDGVLNLGQLYTRSIAKPESSQFHSQAELRELLDMATERGLRRFVDRARSAGIELGSADSDRYTERLAPFFADPDVEAIRAGTSFTFTFRPATFVPDRLAYGQLEQTIHGAQLRIPNVAYPNVGYEYEHKETAIAWRRSVRPSRIWWFDQSGAFGTTWHLPDPGPDADGLVERDDPGVEGFISIWDVASHLALALSFGASLMRTLDLDDAVCDLEFSGIRGRVLVVNDFHRSGLHGRYQFDDEALRMSISLDATDRAAGVEGRVLNITMDVFHRFGWTGVTEELVRGLLTRYFPESS